MLVPIYNFSINLTRISDKLLLFMIKYFLQVTSVKVNKYGSIKHFLQRSAPRQFVISAEDLIPTVSGK